MAASVFAAVFECVVAELEWPVAPECVAEYGDHCLLDRASVMAGVETGLFAGGNIFGESGSGGCANVAEKGFSRGGSAYSKAALTAAATSGGAGS